MRKGQRLTAEQVITDSELAATSFGVAIHIDLHRDRLTKELVDLGAPKNKVVHGYKIKRIGDGEASVLVLTAEAVL